MPSSLHASISYVLQQITRLKPTSVLDVGVGFGKWGFLCREYLDVFHGRVYRHQWQTRIDGIEAFVGYYEAFREAQWQVYDKIIQGRIEDEIDKLENYDLVILGDVVEHLEKPVALRVLRALKRKAKHLILSLPLGDGWLDNVVVAGNDYEKHKSSWTQRDIGDIFLFATPETTFQAGRGPVGVFVLEGEQETTVAAAPTPVAVASSSSGNVMLHVHNVGWIGGTGNFVWDMARCFPEFHHIAIHVNSSVADPEWENAVRQDMRTLFMPQVTPEIIAEIDPRVIVLHSTAGKSLYGDWPYAWLNEGRYVIALHHTATHPLLKADLDVFVSEFVRAKYANILDRCAQTLVMPPCIDVRPYAAINRSKKKMLHATSAGKASPLIVDVMTDFAKAWPSYETKGRKGMNVMPGYLKDFDVALISPETEETWCRTLTECMAAGMFCVAANHSGLAEQIVDGETGILVDGDMGWRQALWSLEKMRFDDFDRIRQAARRWAVENCGYNRMKRDLYPYLMRAVLEG